MKDIKTIEYLDVPFDVPFRHHLTEAETQKTEQSSRLTFSRWNMLALAAQRQTSNKQDANR